MRAENPARDWMPGARAAMVEGSAAAVALLVLLVTLGIAFGDWAVQLTIAALFVVCVAVWAHVLRAGGESEVVGDRRHGRQR